jgi:L-seryl-tRNA(Ser) seleniumtransferase
MTPRTPAPKEREADEGSRSKAASLAALPSVDRVLGDAAAVSLEVFSRTAAVAAIRETLAVLRGRLRAGEDVTAAQLTPQAVVAAARETLAASNRPRLRKLVNATGVVLHTNLGRAWLAEAAVEAVVAAARAGCNLEYDVERGERGDRDALVEEHLCALTGAEAATVVNNNAAAVMLTLNTLAEGREVVVSRGELVEIGGSFRIPEIMSRSGVKLREVGTTNRTHLADYRAAIGPETSLLMKVHASNYRIVGFSSAVELDELAVLAAEHPGVFVVEDLGSGALFDLSAHGLAAEPLVADRIRAGADLVLASGDKLLGGPQCGIIVGRAHLVARLRRNPLKRALRCDKMTLAALEATLRIYRFAPRPESEIPTLRYLTRGVEDLRPIGEEAVGLLAANLGEDFDVELVASEARAGSGSQPDSSIPSLAVAVRSRVHGAQAIERRFRFADPPIIGRIEQGVFFLDLCAIDDPRDLVPA